MSEHKANPRKFWYILGNYLARTAKAAVSRE